MLLIKIQKSYQPKSSFICPGPTVWHYMYFKHWSMDITIITNIVQFISMKMKIFRRTFTKNISTCIMPSKYFHRVLDQPGWPPQIRHWPNTTVVLIKYFPDCFTYKLKSDMMHGHKLFSQWQPSFHLKARLPLAKRFVTMPYSFGDTGTWGNIISPGAQSGSIPCQLIQAMF